MNQPPQGPYTQYPGQPGYPPQQPGQTPPPGYPQGYPPPGYPPMQQQPPQPQQAPKKKKNKLAIGCGSVIALVVLIVIISAVNSGGKGSTTPTTPSSAGGSSSNTTQQQPIKPQTWQTTHTFTGTGAKKTETFAIADDWKITWTCQGTDGIDAPLFVIVYNSDGTMADPSAVSTTCKADGPATTDTSEEHQGGNVYLDINTGIAWTLTIQELK
jgi:hypothetical protein